MISIELQFSVEQVAHIFRDVGLTVQMHDYLINNEMIPILSVQNPFNKEFCKMDEVFKRFIQIKTERIFESNDRLIIYNLFEK